MIIVFDETLAEIPDFPTWYEDVLKIRLYNDYLEKKKKKVNFTFIE